VLHEGVQVELEREMMDDSEDNEDVEKNDTPQAAMVVSNVQYDVAPLPEYIGY